jgi:hypothetical protein
VETRANEVAGAAQEPRFNELWGFQSRANITPIKRGGYEKKMEDEEILCKL